MDRRRTTPYLTAAALALAAATSVAAAPLAAQAPEIAERCQDDAHRAFDFWIGDWRVVGPEGNELGRNRIERAAGGCALLEHWRGAGGTSGTSLNSYHSDTDTWHQNWVGSGGLRLHLVGGRQGESMVMAGRRSTPDGDVHDRITWRPLDGGRVEQVWERSPDGEAWEVVFRGIYEPVGG